MIEEPKLEENEPYQLAPGCPTLTFTIAEKERMVPYHSFKQGTFDRKAIRLVFQAGMLMIHGCKLLELWKHLQLQDVRSVRCNEKADEGDIRVARIVWLTEEDEKTDQEQLWLDV